MHKSQFMWKQKRFEKNNTYYNSLTKENKNILETEMPFILSF